MQTTKDLALLAFTQHVADLLLDGEPIPADLLGPNVDPASGPYIHVCDPYIDAETLTELILEARQLLGR